MKKLAVAMISGLLMSGAFAADIEAGKVKAATCVACHGINGISAVPIYPNLAGQHAAYLESALKAYKTQERKGGNAAIMWGLAAPLSDADIANLAAYFESLDPAGK
jgi:cytochrome c553